MATSAQYRSFAMNLMSMARRAKDADDKARLVEMAQAFLELAEKKEKQARD